MSSTQESSQTVCEHTDRIILNRLQFAGWRVMVVDLLRATALAGGSCQNMKIKKMAPEESGISFYCLTTKPVVFFIMK